MSNEEPNNTATPASSPGLETPKRVRVWDPLVRIFHWSLVAGFATAFIVEDDLLRVHVWAGYLVLVLISVRLVWGLIGTRHARFSDFVRSPGAVLAYLRDVMRLRAPRYLGHNPAGGAMIVLLLTCVAATGISGLALYGAEEFAGPLANVMRGLPPFLGDVLEETHEVFANVTLALILIHVVGVLASSLLHRENLIGGMISGYKRAESE
ncbi:cytochrome b/b6 domain-containing protein [Thiorhodovibrio frisius]|uniref:Cytochrome b n=1 Tax=Thiorhodovibrio frisius TaxID=631362 RepID=H8Z5P6_9GAMM|nr:cytochrome b/b6 domain-containing protein [Thiorhodovibrio frisius]EIC19530.1 cytochrome b [Thiorhodovibrio frisius]WPL20507.1 putative Ni/Fe-hydrogenase B-type cytochrome subunit [Thiorhodovibrio frisius]